MLSLAFVFLFAYSLLPGKTPLCYRFALRISDGIVPEGAFEYCRRLTWVWLFVLLGNAALTAVGGALFARMIAAEGLGGGWFWCPAVNCAASAAVVALTFFVEGRVRRRRFAVTFHTSGSTSTPKTIVKDFACLAREVAYHRRALAGVLSADDPAVSPVFLATIEPEHMYGMLWRVLLPRAAGCRVDPEIIRTPESLLEKMRAAEKVVLVTTPSFLDRFTSYADQYDVPRSCVEIVTSGALLTAEVARRTERVFGLAPREIFGSTETGGVAWRRQSSGATDAASPHDWEVFEPVRVGVEGGRLAVVSPFSYVRRFVMGDGAELAPDGRRFKLLGRMDRLVKISEQRVSLPEMEAKMAALDGVREAALVKLAGEHGDFLGAVVVPRDRPSDDEARRQAALELRRLLLPIFPKGTVPKRYRFVDELPRNPQGKVRAAELKELFS